MQGQPPSIPYHAPVAPSIPPSVAQLIPRLRAAINDIDIFQNMVARGAIDSSMPDWDALLRQYSLLTGRLNALSSYLTDNANAPQPSQPAAGPSRFPSSRPPTSLSQALVEPLNPLPPNSDILTQTSFFESLNTMPLIPLSAHTTELLASEPWHTPERLRGMSEEELEGIRDTLRRRLKTEKRKAEALASEVETQAEGYEWEMRVDDGGGEDEDAEEKQADQDNDDDDDGLFGDDDEEETTAAKKAETTETAPNPRRGWSLVDYVTFLDTGKVPIAGV